MNTLFWFTLSLFLTGWMIPCEQAQIECNISQVQEFRWINVIKWSEQKTKLVNDWWEISSGDMDFLTTIEQESKWNPKAVGDKWRAFWLCQWRVEWFKSIINDKRFGDPQRQLQKCWEYYSEKKANWTIHKQLYWWNVRKKHEWMFEKTFETKEVLACEASQDQNDPNINDAIEKFLLKKKIKYKLWQTWPEYFDCWWIVTFALQQVAWYTGERLSSHIKADFIPFKNAKRGDVLISTIDGERHVAWIAEWFSWWTVTVLDYVKNHTDASYRKYTLKPWIKIISFQ